MSKLSMIKGMKLLISCSVIETGRSFLKAGQKTAYYILGLSKNYILGDKYDYYSN